MKIVKGNQLRILEALEHGELTGYQIQQATGLFLGTIYSTVDELIDDGLVWKRACEDLTNPNVTRYYYSLTKLGTEYLSMLEATQPAPTRALHIRAIVALCLTALGIILVCVLNAVFGGHKVTNLVLVILYNVITIIAACILAYNAPRERKAMYISIAVLLGTLIFLTHLPT